MVILYTRNAINEILRNCTIRTALTVQWRYQRLYLLQTQNYQWMHISFKYASPKDGHSRYILFIIIISEISILVIIPGLPLRTQAWSSIDVQEMMNYKLHVLCISKNVKLSEIQFFSDQSTSMQWKSSLEASLLSCTQSYYISPESSCMLC